MEECLNSILNQVCDFEFKIVVADDFSTDNTRKICKEFKEKYPEKIELLFHNQNYGAAKNFQLVFDVCVNSDANYLAILEGDDYWIDEFKLQKQIEFLEENPDYSSCFTNSFVLEESTGKKIIAKKHIWNEATTAELLLHDDFHKDNLPLSPGHTSTFFFRNGLLKRLPAWFLETKVCDFSLFIMLSKYGKSKFLNEITSVYRVHEHGISSKNFHFENHTKERIFIYQKLNEYLEKKHAKQINTLIAKHYINLLKLYKKNKKFGSSLNALFQIMYYDFKLLKSIL